MIFTIIHVILLWFLQFYPYPELFIYPYLTAKGLIPYTQILDQHFPGLMFFPVNFYSLGFTTPEAFHILLLLIIIINSVWIYKISKNQMAVFFYMVWQPFFEGNQLWLDQFLPLFILPGFWFFVRNNFFISGLLLGLGVVFKQTLVPLLVFIGFVLLVKRQFKNFLNFGIASLIPSVLMLLYFYSNGSLKDFWYWSIQFNLSTYAAQGVLMPTLNQLIKISLPFVLILVSLVVLKRQRLAWLYFGFLSFSIIGGIARFEFIHLQPAMPFFCLLLGLAFKHFDSKTKLFWAVLTLVLAGWFYLQQDNFGTTRFFEKENQVLISEIIKRASPGEEIFLIGVQPHVYAFTRTIPAGRLFVFQFPWFLEKSGQRVLVGLEKSRPKLIVYDSQSQIDGQYLRNYAQYLVQYMNSHYKLVWNLGSTAIYESRN